MISTYFKDFKRLFDERLPEDDLKKIETFRSISGFYGKVYILMLVHLFVLSTKLSINARM
jgi:hypothetical protein